MKKWVLPRHAVVFAVLRFILSPFMMLIFGFRYRKCRMQKDRPYLLLCNHQSFWDPFFIAMFTNRPIHFMATDNVFSNGFLSRLMVWLVAPIPKKKQGADLQAMRACLAVAKKNGVVGVFPEGSRSYSGQPTEIDMGIVQLAKHMKADVLLLRLEGGFGVDPRWGKGIRRGRVFGYAAETLTAEEIAARSEEELLQLFTDTLAVSDSPAKTPYKSSRRAEGIEGAVYLCPRCGAVSTIWSKGVHFGCSACGLKGEYTEHLTLKFANESISLSLQQWMDKQDAWRKAYVPTAGAEIFRDGGVSFAETDRNTNKRVKLGSGLLQLNDTELRFTPQQGDAVVIPVADITIISPVAGRKLVLTTKQGSFFMKGAAGFNPVKYCQMVYHLQGRDDRPIK